MKTLFPHQKLDWSISRLEARHESEPNDHAIALELAWNLVSKGLFHSGEEASCGKALALARKVLNEEEASADALVTAGLALVGMQRFEAAEKYLHQALRVEVERAAPRFGLGLLERGRGDCGKAVSELEAACRMAPDAWEPHLELGRSLMGLAKERGHPRRLVERGQFHMVQAFKREPPMLHVVPLMQDLGIACMLTGRFREAEKFFVRLRQHEEHAGAAWYFLGQVAYELGKYNNAVQHFRQYLRNHPDDPHVLARVAMAWFQLGEYNRTRKACQQALLVDPDNIVARYALGCMQLEEGDLNEAIRTFRETLKISPDHLQSYVELVRVRRMGGDHDWLLQALATEVGQYDRLPMGGAHRRMTRQRIRVVLDELREVGPSVTGAVLACVDRSQDEGLRFQLWETACDFASGAVADTVSSKLRDPGLHFGLGLGTTVLATASTIPEPVLKAGLSITETDVKRAAVSRHGPADDVEAHRVNLSAERDHARAYQALLLLSIAMRRSAAGKALLKSWAKGGDPEISVAAWIGLAMYGDPEASKQLTTQSATKGGGEVVARLLSAISPQAMRNLEPRKVQDGEHTQCTSCGRKPGEVTHMMAGGQVVLCDLCVHQVRHHRSTLGAPDAAVCSLCARSHFEVSGLYRYNKVDVCTKCLQLSMGLIEREEVEQFLADW